MRTLMRSVAVAALLVGAMGQVSVRADQPSPEPLNRLTDAQRAAGWRLLFDGETTEGWRNYRSEEIGSGWKVIDGALTRAERGAGDILTQDQFEAFELMLEFKISPEGNSGVMYHVTEAAQTPWMTGPEIQIQDNARGHDPQKCGWLYQLYRSDEDATKPAGQWNQLRIVITPEECEHYVNGVKYFEYVKGSADWDARVAKSKFAKYEGFGKATKGHLCLQDHGDEVAYRNIKLRELGSE